MRADYPLYTFCLSVVLGQYVQSKTDSEKKAYTDDDTVPDGSKTETFAEFEMRIDNDRWKGTPVVMKTGKGQYQQGCLL